MINLSSIEQLATRLSEALPPGAQQLRGEVEAQFKTVLQKSLGAMELVTREEFDIQTAALERATEKLKILESRLESLES